MDRIGYVYYDGQLAGTLQEKEQGFYFIYDSAFRETGVPIAYSFPLDQAMYYSREFFPFFENLTTEGRMLEIQSRTQQIDPSDKFGLLLKNGGDLAGAVTVLEELI